MGGGTSGAQLGVAGLAPGQVFISMGRTPALVGGVVLVTVALLPAPTGCSLGLAPFGQPVAVTAAPLGHTGLRAAGDETEPAYGLQSVVVVVGVVTGRCPNSTAQRRSVAAAARSTIAAGRDIAGCLAAGLDARRNLPARVASHCGTLPGDGMRP